MLFFFKQKTAYEMRISDWSSDVCSSDLMQVAQTYTLAFAVEAEAASNLDAGGSARSELPTASAEYVVKVQLDSPDFRIDDPVRSLRIAADGLSQGKARFDIVPLHDGAGSINATLLTAGKTGRAHV